MCILYLNEIIQKTTIDNIIKQLLYLNGILLNHEFNKG